MRFLPNALSSNLTRRRRHKLIAKANRLRDARDYAAAAALYAQALRLDPTHAAIQVQAGHMFKEAGAFDQAEAHYRAAERLMPADPDLHLQRGHFFKRAARIPEAIAAYQLAAALSADPAPRNELAALGAVPSAAGRGTLLAARAVLSPPHADGIAALFRIRRRPNPKAIRALRRKADAARDAKQFAVAASLYAEALRLNPDQPALHVQAGHMFKEAGDLDQAETHYREAERRMPDDADLQLQLGHFYKMSNRMGEAIAAYRVAASLSSNAAREELRTLGVPVPTPSSTGSTIRQQTMRVGRIGKKEMRALRQRADTARDAREFTSAAMLYEQVLAHRPADAAIHIQAGHMFKEAGRLGPAESHYLAARTLMPRDADLHVQFGHFYKVAGRLPEALVAYRLALELQSDLADARHELASLSARGVAAQPQESIWQAGALLPRRPDFLFDEAFYREQTSIPADQDAWAHYCMVGVSAGLDPHWLFSTAIYLQASPEVIVSRENPLLHFLRIGKAEGRPMHWLFSASLYVELNPEVALQDALDHLLRHGLAENRQPHPLFLPMAYLARYPNVADARMPALEHFLKNGDREGLTPHPLFDPAFYRKRYNLPPGSQTFRHYLCSGAQNWPNALFDGEFYLHNAPDVSSAGTSPLLHYVAHGAGEGWSPHPLFDPAYYLEHEQSPEARSNPLLHYLTHGGPRGVRPHRLFDPAWYRHHSARSWDGRVLPHTGPRISVLVPVYNTPPDALRACIESVLRQNYASWELCLVDDFSTDMQTIDVLEDYRGTDARIKITRSPSNLHIAGATNFVAQQATGEFLAFLDHDDALAVHALAEVALAVMTNGRIDLLYTDEDKLDFNGQHVEPYCKPDWSKDHLYSVMYVLHLLVVRKALFWRLGGLRPERSGAQDYDLALRASQAARHVHHIPRILYHWRMVPGSAAAVVDAKPYALVAAQKALEDALVAAGANAEVHEGLMPGTFRVRYSLVKQPEVTLLIIAGNGSRDVPGRGRINLVQNFIRSIAERTTYRNYRLVVVDDNGNSAPETCRLVQDVGGEVLSYPAGPRFNYASKVNWATRAAQTEHLIYLNDDMEVITPGWIEALIELSSQEQIGGVGARLLYPDDTVQHAGMVLGINASTAHVFLKLPRDHIGYNGYTHVIRNYSAVTGAVFATRKDVMEAVGGLDERLRIDFNDVDLCLRIGRMGKRIVYTPFCELYHFESSTAVRATQAPEEVKLFTKRWGELIAYDPFYNPASPRDRLNFV
ncbi:glycosyltransferase [Acidisphaera sp. L21]|uniref:glycosyltransferase family 2 protein n=1 Tax=Acidisphaera sp. L21 TaxID=1641851 RepID=UPI00131C97E7|nr:glycosyltransferase [Acidisphaera sp. L21]